MKEYILEYHVAYAEGREIKVSISNPLSELIVVDAGEISGDAVFRYVIKTELPRPHDGRVATS